MADRSAIEWTDASWNPVRARNVDTGKVGWHCEHATTGCQHCYAEGFNKRLGTGLPFKPGHREDIEIFLDDDMLSQPLRWKKPRRIFVGSMTDIFADFVSVDWITAIFSVMRACPQHTFQLLTKRADRMRAIVGGLSCGPDGIQRPLPNVWLGVSAERQEEADERASLLLQTPAAIRFISAEPLLGPLRIFNIPVKTGPNRGEGDRGMSSRSLDWVIVGGESGAFARPMYPDWARSLRNQCAAQGISFFFKQWGEYLPVGQILPGYGKVHGATAVRPGRMKLHYGGTPEMAPKHAFAERGVEVASTADGRLTFRVGKKAAGRLLDGVEHNEFPKVPA